LLCTPHNPLGRVFTRAELAALAALVEAHGARVVSDEVHAPFVYPTTQGAVPPRRVEDAALVSYATVSDAAAHHSVALTSASKGWNLPGLKCAQIVLTNEADTAAWDRLSYMRSSGASILGILANRVAYEEGESWLREVVAYLDGNRALLARLLAGLLPRVRYTIPEGTYLAWLDCRTLGVADPAAFFLQRAQVALTDGATFGRPGQGHVRLNFATSRAILTTIVEAMARSLEDSLPMEGGRQIEDEVPSTTPP
jgi:cystathionine beta-lyase